MSYTTASMPSGQTVTGEEVPRDWANIYAISEQIGAYRKRLIDHGIGGELLDELVRDYHEALLRRYVG